MNLMILLEIFKKSIVDRFERKFLLRQKERDVSAIRSYGIFNDEWYLQQNPDVAQAKINPLRHYVYYGFKEGRNFYPSLKDQYKDINEEYLTHIKNTKKDFFNTRTPLTAPVGLASDFYHDYHNNNQSVYQTNLRNMLSDHDVVQAILADDIPIPATSDREGYFADRHLEYWLSGYQDFRAIESADIPASAITRVLDFGGASGRVARHIVRSYPSAEVIIGDLNINHVEWVERHFGNRAKAVKLSSCPHLPFADDSISLFIAFSVFTHIDAYESTWIAEISRVLSPYGYAYITIHSENTWDLLPNIEVYKAIKDHELFNKLFKPGKPMPQDFIVFDYEYSCNTFIHTNYINKRWSKWLTVLSVISQGHGHQTVIVLRKIPHDHLAQTKTEIDK